MRALRWLPVGMLALTACNTPADNASSQAQPAQDTVSAVPAPDTTPAATPAPQTSVAPAAAQPSQAPAAPAKAAPAVASTAPAPVAAKPAASKPTPASTSASATPATAATPASDPFSIIALANTSNDLLSTYDSDIEDMEIAPSALSRWATGTLRDYAGTYYGPLGSEISSAEIVAAGAGSLNITLGYQSEVVSDDGMINHKQGEGTARSVTPEGTVVQWKKLANIYVTQGQFVTWRHNGQQRHGLLVSGTAKGKPAFVLLHKRK